MQDWKQMVPLIKVVLAVLSDAKHNGQLGSAPFSSVHSHYLYRLDAEVDKLIRHPQCPPEIRELVMSVVV